MNESAIAARTVKHHKFLCWRFQTENVGLTKPGYFKEKYNRCKTLVFLFVGSIFASFIMTSIGYGMGSTMNQGMSLPTSLIFGMVTCLAYILVYVIFCMKEDSSLEDDKP